jgi:hypothetical protein
MNACHVSAGALAVGTAAHVRARSSGRQPQADGGSGEASGRRRWVSPRDGAIRARNARRHALRGRRPEVRGRSERIFDPFFTTKPPGEGTGLGLAIVARTVYDAGGVVWVDRAREGGAVFKVFLPLAGVTDARADR